MKKRKLGRKLLSFLLTLAMVVGLVPGMSVTASAASELKYLDADGTEQSITNYTVVNNSDTSFSSYSGGWYVVNGDVVINSVLMMYESDVNLLLCDGARR